MGRGIVMPAMYCQPDHPDDDHGRGRYLDREFASGEIFMQPIRANLGEQHCSGKDDGEANAPNRIDDCRMGEADCIEDQKRSHSVDEAIYEIPELAVGRGFFGLFENLAAPLCRN